MPVAGPISNGSLHANCRNKSELPDRTNEVQNRCLYREIEVRHSSVLSVPLLRKRGGYMSPMHGIKVGGAFLNSGRRQHIQLGRTVLVPVPGLLSTPDKKNTGYERNAIGNQLRPANPSSASGSPSATDGPRAVVVCADATGCGSRLGLGVRTSGQA